MDLAELKGEYKVLGKAELVLDTYLLKNNPEVMEHLALPLEPSEDIVSKDMEESEKEWISPAIAIDDSALLPCFAPLAVCYSN